MFVDGCDVTPMVGTVRIGDKATVYWRECGEMLSLFVARADGLSALALLHAELPREANTRRRDPIPTSYHHRRAELGAAAWRADRCARGPGRAAGRRRCRYFLTRGTMMFKCRC